MTEAQRIAATVTKEVMAAVDKIMAEKMAEIEESMDKFNGVMRALIIKQHGLTEAELSLLTSWKNPVRGRPRVRLASRLSRQLHSVSPVYHE